jgi:GNAT superfamily N-acetyltransferase
MEFDESQLKIKKSLSVCPGLLDAQGTTKFLDIRRAVIERESEDLAVIAKLEHELHGEILFEGARYSLEQERARLLERQEGRERDNVILAEVDGAARGHSVYSIMMGYCFISSLYVAREFRARGIGARLLELVIKDAMYREAVQVHLTPGGNSESFYKKQGFTNLGDDLKHKELILNLA